MCNLILIINYSVVSWISLRIDALGALFTAALAVYLIYQRGDESSASNTGFLLEMAGM